jgi:molybdopterin molybdotransferase
MTDGSAGRGTRLVADAPISFDEADARVRGEAHALPAETVALADAHGRVLAADIAAPHPVPHFENSTVDGYAVRAADVAGASPDRPVELSVAGEVMAGDAGRATLAPGTALRIMTGAPVPPGADAVVMLEWTEFTPGRVRVEREVEPGRFVRRVGEDIREGDMVLAAGTRIGAAELGVLASLGRTSFPAHRRPRVAVLATGDELLEAHEPLAPGRIRSSNSWTLAAQAREAGAEVRDLGIARDDPADLARRLREGAGADVILTSGGVSVGDRDHVQSVLGGLGFHRIFWRVDASPGKPLLFGKLGSSLVFGVPGNPVSSMVSFENFVRPLLRRLEGDARPGRPRVRAVLSDPVRGPRDRRHFARVRLAWGRDGFIAAEVRPHGSGNLRSMAGANALAVLPEGIDRLERGETAEVMMLGEPDVMEDARR